MVCHQLLNLLEYKLNLIPSWANVKRWPTAIQSELLASFAFIDPILNEFMDYETECFDLNNVKFKSIFFIWTLILLIQSNKRHCFHRFFLWILRVIYHFLVLPRKLWIHEVRSYNLSQTFENGHLNLEKFFISDFQTWLMWGSH